MDLEGVECEAEKNQEVLWDLMTDLVTVTVRIDAVCMLLVVGPIGLDLPHCKVREK
jgi:hypothetical protein